MNAYLPICGDDLFTRGTSWLGPKIRWFTRHRGEPETLASHQGKFLDCCTTVEANVPCVRKYDWLSVARGITAWAATVSGK